MPARAAKKTYGDSWAEQLWSRLAAVDFINKGLLFAAVLLLCLFPFVIVVNALAGRSAVTAIAERMGLNQQAAADVTHAFAPASATSGAISSAGCALCILGGIAATAAVEDLYETCFGVPRRGVKNLPQRITWLAVVVGGSYVAGWMTPTIHRVGGPILLGVVGVIVWGLFWWFSMWLLLAARINWRELLPSAIATAILWVGMEVVFWLTFSSSVISDSNKYGPIGITFALMSYLIAIGVVIILGGVVGVVWRERAVRQELRTPTDPVGAITVSRLTQPGDTHNVPPGGAPGSRPSPEEES